MNKTKEKKEWRENSSYQSKSYKLKKDIVLKFAKACRNANVPQSVQLMKMMNEFINEQNGFRKHN